jgi:Golgi apparatus protein 1
MKFRERKLRKDCEKQLSVVLKEAALNYKLNPLLQSLCTQEVHKYLCSNYNTVPSDLHNTRSNVEKFLLLKQIQSLCNEEVNSEERGDTGRVEECLKVAFVDGRIERRACRLEVAGLIEEAKADIHVDPLLHNACALDITKYCIDVPQGAGRSECFFVIRFCKPIYKSPLSTFSSRTFAVLQCLQTILFSDKQRLQSDCKHKLTQRMEMFKNAEPLVSYIRYFQWELSLSSAWSVEEIEIG